MEDLLLQKQVMFFVKKEEDKIKLQQAAYSAGIKKDLFISINQWMFAGRNE